MFIHNARYLADITILSSFEFKSNLQLKNICHFALLKSRSPFILEYFQLSFFSFLVFQIARLPQSCRIFKWEFTIVSHRNQEGMLMHKTVLYLQLKINTLLGQLPCCKSLLAITPCGDFYHLHISFAKVPVPYIYIFFFLSESFLPHQ